MGMLLQLTQKLAHGFLGFYSRYPRKEARKDAEKAWGQLKITPETEDAIHKALDWQIPLYEQRERHFIPLPASWLRGERWTDEPPSPKTKVTLSPTIGRRTEDAIKHQNVTAQIQFLVQRGMSLEEAKRQVYKELKWIKD
jgi:hypothetical protein